jgi:cyanophycin synthetase
LVIELSGKIVMRFDRLWALRGPNVWAGFSVFEVEVDLRSGAASLVVPELGARLASWLRPAATNHDTFLVPLRDSCHPAACLQHLALALQALSGSPVQFGIHHEVLRSGLARVVVEYEEEELGRACLEAARQMCEAALEGRACDVPAEMRRLRDLAHELRLGPSTMAIVRAARERGIPVRRLNSGSLVQLGQGACQRRVWTAETDATSSLAEDVAQDKDLTRAMLRTVGVPVPEGRPVRDAEDAWAAAQEIGPPVVVKPRFGNQGRGVATDLTTREQILAAYAAARAEGDETLVERFLRGADYRLLVIGGRLVAAALREPAHVRGDGVHTVAELVDEVNRDPRRSDGHSTALSYIRLDPIGLAVLAEQGYTPESVPPQGSRVLIRRNGNLSTGGTATDVTDQVHPEVARRAVEAARAVGLDIAGVDVVAEGVSRSLEEVRGGVVEVNAGPGLRMHLEPSAGQPRPVGEAIVGTLYPEGKNGRIPIVAVTGVNGKTTTTRLVAHLLRGAGLYVGMTCTDGIYLNGRRTETRDCSGPRSARDVLLHPRVEAAVLETARGGILREGLGFDQCDVAVVTNIGKGDHLGLRGIDTLADLVRVKRTVVNAVAPTGAAVLNAGDPLVTEMSRYCAGKVTWFCRDPANAIVTAHTAAGGCAVLVRDGALVLARGAVEEEVMMLERVPLTRPRGISFQVENVLAAAAAAWSLGLPAISIRAGLESFTGDSNQLPGRFNVWQVGDSVIIADYAHNPSAVAALAAALEHYPQRRRTLVFTGCNRRDDDVIEMGQIAGDSFDRVLLYADRGNRDRGDGDLNTLLRRGLASGKRVCEVREVGDEGEAIRAGLQELGSEEVLVLGIEAIEQSLRLIEACLNAKKDSAGMNYR